MSQRNTGVTVEFAAPEEEEEERAMRAEAHIAPEDTCAVREVLDRIGGKWSIQIILAAAERPTRFTELERSIQGISRRMLALTLRSLERDGLLVRTVYPTVPAKVVYSVTDSARELHDAFLQLMNWAERNRSAITAARIAYDAAAEAAQREQPESGPR